MSEVSLYKLACLLYLAASRPLGAFGVSHYVGIHHSRIGPGQGCLLGSRLTLTLGIPSIHSNSPPCLYTRGSLADCLTQNPYQYVHHIQSQAFYPGRPSCLYHSLR